MESAAVDDIWLTLTHAANLEGVLAASRWREVTPALARAVVEQAADFSAREIAPLRAVGDAVGAVIQGRDVTMPPGWRDLYHHWIEGGWNGITAPEAFGGQGLPMALGVAALEVWNTGSMAFAIGPTLTMGAIETIHAHASEALKEAYLARLTAGTWMATMNLTEPQAGSDLGGVRTRAEPAGDGSFRLFGQKIYITYGEHDLTDNIVHLVLARLPGAPAGTRGLSLFLVPKILPEVAGTPGRRNDVICAGLEHKLGIHASPTCTMVFGDGTVEGFPAGAVGWLVGEANRGLACMFTMMNNARLAVGIQGVGIAEAATTKALAYAKERRQGRAAGAGDASPIAAHPDVRRMLLTMRAMTMAARAICYACAAAIDHARAGPAGMTAAWQASANLLTPIAKAFATDIGVEVASLGVQVHGGMGFIEGTGAAMLLRDARIAPIYEGTNGIQAIDLVTRKLGADGGEAVRAAIAGMRRDQRSLGEGPLSDEATQLGQALDDLEAATTALLDALERRAPDAALAGATPYLRLFALALGGCLMGRMAAASTRPDPVDAFRFYVRNLLAETGFRRLQVTEGARSVVAVA